MIRQNKQTWNIWVEYIFVAAIVAGMTYTVWFFRENGYLPQPFFYEPSGTFMDWYSLASWGHYRGAYDIAGSIYPPLSFVLLKISSFPSCYVNNVSEWARGCDWLGIVVLSAIMITNAVLTFMTFYKIDRRTFLPRAFALSFGLPMLFTFERGNMLLFCYTCVLLGFGPLIRSARLRWFFAGLAINFKVYLFGAALAPLLHRRWIQTEGMIISALIIYLVTWMILGEGSPAEVYENVAYYANGIAASRVLDLWYPSSLVPAISLLRGDSFPVTTILDSRIIDILLMVAVNVLRITELLIVLAAVATWLRPEVVPRYRVVFLAIAMAVTTSEVSGYTQTMLILFVFMERWKGWGRPLAISLSYMLCIPAEYVKTKLAPVIQWSWLQSTEVFGEYGVGFLSILRPIIVLLIVWSLALVTLNQVWADIQKQGWKTRWRFRRDFPIMSGEGFASSYNSFHKTEG